MKKVRVILFLLVFGMFAASIPQTPLSPVYQHSTVRADGDDGEGQDGCGGGRGKTCNECVWVCLPMSFCFCLPYAVFNP